MGDMPLRGGFQEWVGLLAETLDFWNLKATRLWEAKATWGVPIIGASVNSSVEQNFPDNPAQVPDGSEICNRAICWERSHLWMFGAPQH